MLTPLYIRREGLSRREKRRQACQFESGAGNDRRRENGAGKELAGLVRFDIAEKVLEVRAKLGVLQIRLKAW